MVSKLVILDEVARDGLAVVRAEELGGCVPELSRIVGGDVVQLVFELGIALAKEGVELGFVAHVVEVKGLARVEDDGLLREVAIIGVV